MHWHTCESLLNTLRGAVEQWLGALLSKHKSAIKVKSTTVMAHAKGSNVL